MGLCQSDTLLCYNVAQCSSTVRRSDCIFAAGKVFCWCELWFMNWGFSGAVGSRPSPLNVQLRSAGIPCPMIYSFERWQPLTARPRWFVRQGTCTKGVASKRGFKRCFVPTFSKKSALFATTRNLSLYFFFVLKATTNKKIKKYETENLTLKMSKSFFFIFCPVWAVWRKNRIS